MNSKTQPWLRTFLIIFTGQAFSLLGSSAVNFAVVWWLTAETGSATVLAYTCIAALVPQALLAVLAGPLIDRWDRRLIMIFADLFIAGMSLVLLVVFWVGRPSTMVVIAIIAFRSVGAAFHTPASQAAVPMYVPPEHLMRVAGWNFFLSSGVAMAGPVLGAFLMGVAPMSTVIMLDAVGAVLAVGSLLLVRIPHPQRLDADPKGAGFVAEFREGWRELVRHRGLLELTLVLTLVTLLYMPLNALFPLMTLEHFGGGSIQASIAELSFGTGMLVGSLGIGSLSARFSGVRLIGSGILVMGSMIGLSGLLPSSGFWLFAALCIIIGSAVPLFGAPLTALFQTLIEPSKLGRVMSIYLTITMLISPVGLVLAGPLAERTGVAPWFAASGVALFLSGVLMWVAPGVRQLDRAPAAKSESQKTSVGNPAGGEVAVPAPEGSGE